jgi:hypothetical protein|tara:strand:- start:4079 stop:5182 length:1104 start_codon:yes stop_codon:yes gene_type:complete
MIGLRIIRKTIVSVLQKYGLIGSPETPSHFSKFPMIYIGRVKSEVDPFQGGGIEVTLPHLGTPVDVTYSTPYHGKGGSGFWAVPEKDTVVMVAHIPDGNPSTTTKKKYVYLGSIPNPDVPYQVPGSNMTGPYQTGGILPDKDIYKARARPMKYVWKSPKGHSFTMSDCYDPSFFNTRIEMKSHLDKKIVCDDSPDKSCILIQNEHGDHFKISTDGVSPHQAAREVECWSMGPQSYTTHQSEFDVRVVDGWNLNIVNTSTGKNAPNPDKVKSWGTVNLLAQNNDMTLTCNEGKGTPMKDVPSMFITTNGKDSVIRIDSRGTHVVQINKQIKITSETQGIDIEAEADINMTSNNGNINISTPNGVINLN